MINEPLNNPYTRVGERLRNANTIDELQIAWKESNEDLKWMRDNKPSWFDYYDGKCKEYHLLRIRRKNCE